jgi:phenylacetate-coenzyme A ligase PaaK-like adenylate-forming protein
VTAGLESADFSSMPIFETIVEFLPRLTWTPEELDAHRRDALAATLRAAGKRSAWHRERLDGIDVAAVTPDDLSALPTMTKRDLMANWDDVVTDPRLTLASARAHLERVDAEGLSPLLGEYLVFTSGGTTGEPGIFCWSLPEMARFAASSLRWGDRSTGPPARLAAVAARSMRYPTAAVVPLAGGSADLLVPVDQPIAAIVEQLNAVQPDAIITHCSMLEPLTDEAAAGRLRVDLERISLGGDVLDRATAERARHVFGCEPLEGYPTTDVGYIAQQAAGEAGLYVNDDLLIVEAVDHDERPVPPGELSDHLLVTSLHRHSLPLIRYRIDDRVRFDPEPGQYRAYRRIAQVDGRSDDVFRYGSATVHPHVFRSALGRYLEVRDYEVQQTATGAHIGVEVDGTVDREALETDLRVALARAGLTDPEVQVEVAPELGRTQAGKRRRFVPMR